MSALALQNPVLHFDNLELDTHIRVLIQDNSPIFVAKDVCAALGLNNSRQAIVTLEEDEKITVTNPDGNPRAGIPHELTFVTESGLYALVFKSRKEAARRFRKWVTAEVLPALRQRLEIRSLPAWLEAMHYHIGQGAPPDVAKVAALVGIGVDPTTAAKLVMPRVPRITRSTPVIDSPDILDADDDALFLAQLTPAQEYCFIDLVDIASRHGFFPRCIELREDGSATDQSNARFGLRLNRIAQRVEAFRIIGRGRSRRYVLLKDKT